MLHDGMAKKNPAENNNPEEEREVKQTSPTNPHPPQPPSQRENHRHYTYITVPHKLPPTSNTYPTKEIHTPPFIDPPDIPLDKPTCNT